MSDCTVRTIRTVRTPVFAYSQLNKPILINAGCISAKGWFTLTSASLLLAQLAVMKRPKSVDFKSTPGRWIILLMRRTANKNSGRYCKKGHRIQLNYTVLAYKAGRTTCTRKPLLGGVRCRRTRRTNISMVSNWQQITMHSEECPSGKGLTRGNVAKASRLTSLVARHT